MLRAIWEELGAAFSTEIAESRSTVQDFLKKLDPAWNVVGRVHFNLAENRKDEQAPFAFLATYTSRLSAHGKAQHQPLGQALREYAGAASKERLLSLLLPIQRAAERCAWLKQMVDAGEIYQPLRWSSREALQFLSDVPELEQAGIVVRMPAVWRSGRPPQALGQQVEPPTAAVASSGPGPNSTGPPAPVAPDARASSNFWAHNGATRIWLVVKATTRPRASRQPSPRGWESAYGLRGVQPQRRGNGMPPRPGLHHHRPTRRSARS